MGRLNPEYLEFLSACNGRGVEYLVIGGQAVIFYGYVRTTRDLDVWIGRSYENAQRVCAAIGDFGILTTEAFMDGSFAIGDYPYRIELFTEIPKFSECYSRRIEIDVDGVRVPFIQVDDLIQNKRVAGRLQDLADVSILTRRRGK